MTVIIYRHVDREINLSSLVKVSTLPPAYELTVQRDHKTGALMGFTEVSWKDYPYAYSGIQMSDVVFFNLFHIVVCHLQIVVLFKKNVNIADDDTHIATVSIFKGCRLQNQRRDNTIFICFTVCLCLYYFMVIIQGTG